MPNRYPGSCFSCGQGVARGGGVAFKSGGRWLVACQAHKANAAGTDRYRRGQTTSTYARFSSGAEVFMNRNGRCEDAPCCGCCT